MKRYYRAVAATAIMICGLGSVGCANRTGVTLEDRYRNAVDVAWPERYNYQARESVLAPFAQQAATGHFLDQTIWNWYFEPGTDKLTQGGIDKLNALARETPGADPRLYIQTARDVTVTQDNADKINTIRDDLNARRAVEIKKYMATQPGVPVAYEVFVHDAPVPSIYAPFAVAAFAGQRGGYKGGLSGGAGSQGVGGGTMGQSQAPVTSTTVNNNSGGGAGAGPGGGVSPGSGGPGSAP